MLSAPAGGGLSTPISGGPAAPDGAGLPAPGGADDGPRLDRLLQDFGAGAPEAGGSAVLDAWVEADDGHRVLVVVVEPEGETKLVADPGITVAPAARPGISWQVPLPHRHVDPTIEYFPPPAAVRLPFEGDAAGPLEVRVEYAYCVVDFQCFFSEETLSVANVAN